jgi:hypothetical protein
MDANTVVRLRDGTFEFRLNGLAIRLREPEALTIFERGMDLCGYTRASDLGLKVGEGEPRPMTQWELTDAMERLRAGGRAMNASTQTRTTFLGPWGDETPDPRTEAGPRQRRFTKEVAKTPEPPKKTIKKAAKAGEQPVSGDWSITDTLFEDPRAQLRYEVRHAYLMTVPISQREQWPLPPEYELFDTFMNDIESQAQAVSRQQIVAAVLDVVSGRMNDVNSRRPRPLREGGGDDGRAIITRSDGAMAWRANVSAGTPAARRIMWWRRTDNVIQLARLSTHDEFEMPER